MIRHPIRWSRSSCRLLSSPDSKDFRLCSFWLLSCALVLVNVFFSRPTSPSLAFPPCSFPWARWFCLCCLSLVRLNPPPRFLLTILITPPWLFPWLSPPPIRWYMLPLRSPWPCPLPASSTSSLLTVLSDGVPWFLLFPRAPSPPILYPLALART